MRVYFDFLSPYAYLAWKQLPPLAARFGEPIEPVPVLLAALAAAARSPSPDRAAELAARAGLPLVAPLPFNPLLALRVAAVPGPDQVRVIDALFDATWGTGAGVADARAITRALVRGGLDPTVLDEATGPKDRLRTNCDEALRGGVRGVPTVRVHEALVSGEDVWVDVEVHLARAERRRIR